MDYLFAKINHRPFDWKDAAFSFSTGAALGVFGKACSLGKLSSGIIKSKGILGRAIRMGIAGIWGGAMRSANEAIHGRLDNPKAALKFFAINAGLTAVSFGFAEGLEDWATRHLGEKIPAKPEITPKRAQALRHFGKEPFSLFEGSSETARDLFYNVAKPMAKRTMIRIIIRFAPPVLGQAVPNLGWQYLGDNMWYNPNTGDSYVGPQPPGSPIPAPTPKNIICYPWYNQEDLMDIWTY